MLPRRQRDRKRARRCPVERNARVVVRRGGRDEARRRVERRDGQRRRPSEELRLELELEDEIESRLDEGPQRARPFARRGAGRIAHLGVRTLHRLRLHQHA